MYYSNPIVLKIPCAKFNASSCCQTKVKVEGQFCPLTLPPIRPPKHTPKKEVQKAHLEENYEYDNRDKANLERLKVFCVQSLLRQYAPCEHNSIDDFAK